VTPRDQSALKERLDEASECGCKECKAFLALVDEVKQTRRIVQAAREIVTMARAPQYESHVYRYARAMLNLMTAVDALPRETS